MTRIVTNKGSASSSDPRGRCPPEGLGSSVSGAEGASAKRDTGTAQVSVPSVEARIRLYHCPFQKLEEVARIELNSVNLILTDIPYGEDFLPEVAELGAFAARVLVEGGLLVSYSGQYHLDM